MAQSLSFKNPVPVTPDDDNDISTRPTDGIRVNATGTVKLTWESGRTGTYLMLGGVDYYWAIKRVWSTDTDANVIAAGIDALYL